MSVCVFAYVCVCVREREREREMYELNIGRCVAHFVSSHLRLNQLEQTKGKNLTNPRSEAKPLRPGTFFRNGNLFLPIVRGLFIFFLAVGSRQA